MAEQQVETFIAEVVEAEVREAFREHPRIPEALASGKRRKRGRDMQIVVTLPIGDLEMIAQHLVAMGGKFAVTGRGLQRRLPAATIPQAGVDPFMAVPASARAVSAPVAITSDPDYRDGLNQAMTAFDEDLNDPAYVQSAVAEAHRYYAKRVTRPDASPFERGMADGFAKRTRPA